MKTETKKCYLLHNLSGNYTIVVSHNWAASDPGQYVLLAEKEVEFELLKSDSQLVQEQVAALEIAKTKVRAEMQKSLNKLDLHIQNLLSITHQTEEETP